MTEPLSASSFPRLFVVLPESADIEQPLQWFAPDSNQQGLAALAALPAAMRTTLLLAPPQLASYQLTLPRRPQHKLLPLIRHALEDRMLVNTDTLHLATRQARDGATQVHGCDKHWLRTWQAHCQAAGRTVIAGYALIDLVPATQAWRWLPLAAGGLLLSPDGEAARLDHDADAHVLLPDGAALQTLSWLDLLQTPLPNPIELLHGEFARRTAVMDIDWKPLRRLACLGGVLLAVLYLAQLGQWWQLRSTTTALQREVRQSFAAAFPGEPIVDPVLQLASKLRAAGLSQDGGSQKLSDWLARIEGALDSDIQLSALDFRDGALRLTLNGNEANSAVSKLIAAGFNAALTNEGGKNVITLSEKSR
ncbi:type II secretion system protein GspL [Andreprevotia sp. IGB-42]|uniref:type II secretion system protein GspL n=1 Tax=Andreprevotia sp. IGB-42 TaxID=2497473 RepID=UPI001356F3AA|nr:type II secretion system protein GspL [Andreprevotia sp. IGB-42]